MESALEPHHLLRSLDRGEERPPGLDLGDTLPASKNPLVPLKLAVLEVLEEIAGKKLEFRPIVARRRSPMKKIPIGIALLGFGLLISLTIIPARLMAEGGKMTTTKSGLNYNDEKIGRASCRERV